MKNIYILPTDKPSRLFIDIDDNKLKITEPLGGKYMMNQNICITSNEEITGFEDNIWVIKGERIFFWQNIMALVSNNKPKKIILTTDKDLIKEGVQAIPDEFLEWFVKNPSCEEVVFSTYHVKGDISGKLHYKIIIPKEEAMSYEEFRKKASNDLIIKFDTDCSRYSEDGNSDNYFYANCKYWENKLKEEPKPFKDMLPLTKVQWEKFKKNPIPSKKEEPKQELERGITITQVSKQETLEEATRKYLKNCKEAIHDNIMFIQGSNFGVKWQQERSYSKEEVKEQLNLILAMKNSLLDTFTDDNGFITDKWFEKFKKK